MRNSHPFNAFSKTITFYALFKFETLTAESVETTALKNVINSCERLEQVAEIKVICSTNQSCKLEWAFAEREKNSFSLSKLDK